MITQSELKEILDYDKETGVFTWKASRSRVKVGQVAGTNSQGYIRIKINRKLYMAHCLAWLYVYGKLPIKEVDHENQIKNHNWIKNLREVTHQQNLQNIGNRKNNTTGFKGVCFYKSSNKWVSYIKIQGKSTFLGYYKTPELAADAYKKAQEKYHSHRPQI